MAWITTINTVLLPVLNVREIPTWMPISKGLNSNVTKKLFGVAKINGIAAPNTVITVYYKPTGVLAKKAITNSDGEFNITGMPETLTPEYFAIAFTEEPYNAVIFDKLIPS